MIKTLYKLKSGKIIAILKSFKTGKTVVKMLNSMQLNYVYFDSFNMVKCKSVKFNGVNYR